jgi:hypothetical protein
VNDLTPPIWKAKPVSNFSNDLFDGVVILSVIKAHAQFLNFKIHYHPEGEEKLNNIKTIIQVIKDLGFDSVISEKDFINADARAMLLLVYTLFLVLPQCFPSTNPEVCIYLMKYFFFFYVSFIFYFIFF